MSFVLREELLMNKSFKTIAVTALLLGGTAFAAQAATFSNGNGGGNSSGSSSTSGPATSGGGGLSGGFGIGVRRQAARPR